MNITIQNSLNKLFIYIFYPKKIIPKVGFKKEIQIDELKSFGEVGIVRRSLKNREGSFDKIGLREDALISSLKDVPGLSMNLLGDTFKTWHNCFLLSNLAGKYWDGEETNLWKAYRQFVFFKSKPVNIFFFLSDLHKITFPYRGTKDEKEIKRLCSALKLTPDAKNEVELLGASIIKHCPSRLNYWHIEFRLLDINARTTNAVSLIVREKVKTYNDPAYREDITKQSWVNRAADIALRDILLQTAIEKLSGKAYCRIGSSAFLD